MHRYICIYIYLFIYLYLVYLCPHVLILTPCLESPRPTLFLTMVCGGKGTGTLITSGQWLGKEWKMMKHYETCNMRSKPASYTTTDHDLELHACCIPLNLTPRLAGLLDRHRHWDLVVGWWARLWHRHVALLVNVLWHLAGRDNVKTGIWIHLGETIPLPQWFHGVPHLPHTTIVMRMTLPCEHMGIQETTWGWPGTGTLITFGGSLHGWKILKVERCVLLRNLILLCRSI